MSLCPSFWLRKWYHNQLAIRLIAHGIAWNSNQPLTAIAPLSTKNPKSFMPQQVAFLFNATASFSISWARPKVLHSKMPALLPQRNRWALLPVFFTQISRSKAGSLGFLHPVQQNDKCCHFLTTTSHHNCAKLLGITVGKAACCQGTTGPSLYLVWARAALEPGREGGMQAGVRDSLQVVVT